MKMYWLNINEGKGESLSATGVTWTSYPCFQRTNGASVMRKWSLNTVNKLFTYPEHQKSQRESRKHSLVMKCAHISAHCGSGLSNNKTLERTAIIQQDIFRLQIPGRQKKKKNIKHIRESFSGNICEQLLETK